MVKLLESCRIAPPPSAAAAEQFLPLTFFDIMWVPFHPIRRLMFYEIPCSEPDFLETLVPKLKHSLSLTLEHYLPLAGNLIYPLNTDAEKPIIRFVPGDSVSLTIVESTHDFENLVGNHPRDADIFYDYIPQLDSVDEANHKLLQLLAVQITLFPDRGVCIGFANHHSVADATSIVGFINSWASVNKLGGDSKVESFPLFDRSIIEDRLGIESKLWNDMRAIPVKKPSFPLPTNRVRATYVLSQSDLKKLKDSAIEKNPGLTHVSSFVVMAAYTWSCLAKALVAGEKPGKVDDDDHDDDAFFLFAVDTRTRFDPPLPGNYFGNCISYGLVKLHHPDLLGNEGFNIAAKAISLEIQNEVSDKDKLLKRAEDSAKVIGPLVTRRFFSVSGSARVDLYGKADFGWGKARKVEWLSIDEDKYSISLCKAREFEGGLEIGLSLPKVNMDAFAAMFADGLIKG